MTHQPARLAALGLLHTAVCGAQDWPEWRGADRNGVQTGAPELSDTWPAAGPARRWTSRAEIPSGEVGGHGSPVVVGDRVYLSFVERRPDHTAARHIDQETLRSLGYRHLDLPAKLIDEIEAARARLSPRLRGRALSEWLNAWIAENLPADQSAHARDVKQHFRAGPAALRKRDLDKLATVKDRVFANRTELEAWVRQQGFARTVTEKILRAIPDTSETAEAVVLCIDAARGRTVWRTSLPAAAAGRPCSSTPCVRDGRLYAVGGPGIFCLDAVTGDPLWETKASVKGVASSPVVQAGVVIAQLGALTAFDARTGELRWMREELRHRNTSPAIWRHGGRAYVISNTSRQLAAVDPNTGEIVWQVAGGGGDSTPAISGDYAAIYSSKKHVGLAVYQLEPTGATRLWARPIKAQRHGSSPTIYRGHVYLLGGGQHLCVDSRTGRVKWARKLVAEISSPIFAAGKIFAVHTNGSFVSMLRATPDSYRELARARIRGLRCPSPAIANGRLYVRSETRLICFDLR